MALLTCKGLALGYDGHEIINGLEFTAESGDYLCIVGENGSGKTTLMKTILGLQPPLAGEIATGDGLKRCEIGYLPQQTDIQKDFPASVREIVLSGCLNRIGFKPFYGKNEKLLAEENIARVGMTEHINDCYRELSGGQQQRVLLARALCAARKLILLDEPVAGLDPTVTAEMYSLIEHLNKQHGVTVIMISHDIASAIKYANRILHIGEKVFFGTTGEYLADPASENFAKGGGAE